MRFDRLLLRPHSTSAIGDLTIGTAMHIMKLPPPCIFQINEREYVKNLEVIPTAYLNSDVIRSITGRKLQCNCNKKKSKK